MAAKIYRFKEHNLVVEGEKEDLLYLAELLRYAEGTVGDLRYQIEYEFDVDGVRSANETIGEQVLQLLDEKVNEVFAEMQNKLNIQNGDIAPIDALELDKYVETLGAKIEDILKTQ